MTHSRTFRVLFVGSLPIVIIPLCAAVFQQSDSSEPVRTVFLASEKDGKYGWVPGFLRPRVFVSSDGNTLVTGQTQLGITIWDTRTWQQKKRVDTPPDTVLLSVTGDSKLIATAIIDETTVSIWDTESGQHVHAIYPGPSGLAHPRKIFSKAAFSPDGKMLATAQHAGKSVDVWDTSSWERLNSIDRFAWAKRPEFIACGSSIAIWLYDRDRVDEGRPHFVEIWDFVSPARRLSLRPAIAGVTSVAYSPNSKRVIVGASEDSKFGVLSVFDLQTGKELLRWKATAGERGWVYVAFSPTGRTVATCSLDGLVKVWNADTGNLMQTFIHDAPVLEVAYFPDGSRLATQDRHGALRIWQMPEEPDTGVK